MNLLLPRSNPDIRPERRLEGRSRVPSGTRKVGQIMAHFRATIQGQRGGASRLGSAKSGIAAAVNGWDIGVTIEAGVHENGQDVLYVYATGGSLGRRRSSLIARVMVEGVDVAADGTNDADS